MRVAEGRRDLRGTDHDIPGDATAQAALGAYLHVPLWDVPYPELEARLWGSGAVSTVSAIADDRVQTRVGVGELCGPHPRLR